MANIMQDEQTQKEEEHRARESVTTRSRFKKKNHAWFGLILIAVGIVFLGNNFGLIDWNVWGQLWRLWPLIIIFWGLQSVLGTSIVSNIILFVIVLVVIATVVLSVFANRSDRSVRILDRSFNWVPDEIIDTLREEVDDSLVTSEITVSGNSYKNITSREVNFDIGSEMFTLEQADSDDHVHVKASLPSGSDEPNIALSQKNEALSIDISSSTNTRPFAPKGSYTTTIGQRDIPTDLSLDLGSGKATITTDDLAIQELDLHLGSGIIELYLSEDTNAANPFNLDVGSGIVTVYVPETVTTSIKTDIGSGMVKFFESNITDNEVATHDASGEQTGGVTFNVNLGSGIVTFKTR